MATKKTAIKKQPEESISPTLEKKKQLKKYELRKKGFGLGLQSGGRATHGYGKAYMKGGKVK